MGADFVDGRGVVGGASRRARVRRGWVAVGFVALVGIACSALALMRGTTEDRLVEAVVVTGADRDPSGDWVRPDGSPLMAFRLPDGSVLDVDPPDGFELGWVGEDSVSSSYGGIWEGQRCRVGVIVLRDSQGTVTWNPATEQRVFVEADCPGWPIISL